MKSRKIKKKQKIDNAQPITNVKARYAVLKFAHHDLFHRYAHFYENEWNFFWHKQFMRVNLGIYNFTILKK